jgi:hypothetical protein
MKKLLSILIGIFFVVSISNVYGEKATKEDSDREVIYEENFDDLEEGEEIGWNPHTGVKAMTVQKEIAQGKKALKVEPKEGKLEWNLFGIVKDISIINDEAKISFSYYQKGLSGMALMAKDVVVDENCDFNLPNLVEGKWTKVIASFSKFIPKGPAMGGKGGKVSKGDEFRNIYIFGVVDPNKPSKDQFFVIDDIKITVKK